MTIDERQPVDRLITVCASCLRASCWQYEFCCEEYKTAGTVMKPESELRQLNLEHPSWFTVKQASV